MELKIGTHVSAMNLWFFW